MKKKVLLSMSLLSAAVVGASPVASYAAQVKVVQVCPGGGYQVLSGEDDECLQQIMNQLDGIIGNIGNYCPTTPECTVPETEAPETEAPETEAPETEAPGTEAPETEAPETEAPETQAQETEAPQTEVPETEAPQTETPETEAPETEAPETEAPQMEAPQTEAPVVQEPKTDAAALSYAEQIVKLVNAERAKEGLPAVQLDAQITAAANIRAREIVQQFAHTRPNGSSFYTVLKENGISYMGCGENIAYGQRSAEEVMDGWMNSSGHRANIMNKNYKNIGVGYYQDARGVKYWVKLFTY